MGPDGISAKLVKKATASFSPLLTLCYEIQKISKRMKCANVIPIFKSGDNYHPVSITSICSKIMESTIKDNTGKHLRDMNIMHPNQHGFCRGKSTATNLMEFWDNVTNAA